MSKNNQQVYKKLLEAELIIDKLVNGNVKAIQVELLHQYNDIKDATQIVIQHIANIEGTSVTEIHRRLQLTD